MEGTVIQMAKEVVGEHLSRDPKTLGAPQYNDIKTISAELTTAGFTSITAEKVAKRSHSASALEAAIATCHGGLLRAEIEKYAPHQTARGSEPVADRADRKGGAAQHPEGGRGRADKTDPRC